MTDPLSLSLFIGTLSDPFAFIALVCATALGLSLVRRSYGLSFFLTVGATFALTHIIKSIAKVPRPDDALISASGYRFPSMHAAIAGAVIASLLWHVLTRTSSWSLRIPILVVSAVLVALVGATRVYLGVHQTIDVIAGALLGASIGIVVHVLMKRLGLE